MVCHSRTNHIATTERWLLLIELYKKKKKQNKKQTSKPSNKKRSKKSKIENSSERSRVKGMFCKRGKQIKLQAQQLHQIHHHHYHHHRRRKRHQNHQSQWQSLSHSKNLLFSISLSPHSLSFFLYYQWCCNTSTKVYSKQYNYIQL